MIQTTGGPPGKNVDRTPLTSWVKVAAPNFLTTSTTVKVRIVLIGIAITAYNPGRGAGINVVVKVVNEDMHPKIEIKAMSFTEK